MGVYCVYTISCVCVSCVYHLMCVCIVCIPSRVYTISCVCVSCVHHLMCVCIVCINCSIQWIIFCVNTHTHIQSSCSAGFTRCWETMKRIVQWVPLHTHTHARTHTHTYIPTQTTHCSTLISSLVMQQTFWACCSAGFTWCHTAERSAHVGGGFFPSHHVELKQPVSSQSESPDLCCRCGGFWLVWTLMMKYWRGS